MEVFAVLDTETNWRDEVMSIGVVIADAGMELLASRYYIIEPEYQVGGMFSSVLVLEGFEPKRVCSREEAFEELHEFFAEYEVEDLFAYNAAFDCKHMPEFERYNWYDIMRIAAYRQYNPAIESYPCCKTGKMRSGYGVQAMTRILSGNNEYYEKHNALTDALDELVIMKLLKRAPKDYIILQEAR